MSAIDRFLAKVEWGEKFQGTRCLVWTGGDNGRGYGRFYFEGVTVYAHRWLYERWIGPIPVDSELDHLCKTPACVNPDHLEPVSHLVNMQRGAKRMRTHCSHGHEYTEENTYLYTDRKGRVSRRCRTCHREEARV